jgi:hypothetical protein
MFCVIQKLQRKQPDKRGAGKELLVSSFYHNGLLRYTYSFGGGQFERPIRTAYKVIIQASGREVGKEKKQQHVVCTFGYYDLVGYACDDGDDIDFDEARIQYIAKCLNTDEDEIYGLIWDKLEPLCEQAKAEFKTTEEYRIHSEHQDVLLDYEMAKRTFTEKYGCAEDMYDYVYNVYGKLMNRTLLHQIVKGSNEQIKKKCRDQSASQSSKFDISSKPKKTRFEMLSDMQLALWERYGELDNKESRAMDEIDSIFMDMYVIKSLDMAMFRPHYFRGDKSVIKKLYRMLSKIYHPDNNAYSTGDKEGHEEIMKFINEMKPYWDAQVELENSH